MTSSRLLRLLVPAVLLLGACAGAEPAADTAVPVSTTVVVAEEPDSDPCDVNAAGQSVDCAEEDLVVEESVEGAVERVIEEETWDSDLRYLLLDEEAYAALLAPALGDAEFVPGGAMPVYGFYVPALAAFTEPLSWQQEWRLAAGGVIVEQAVLLPTEGDAASAFDLWKASALASGLSEVEGRSATGFTTAYADPANPFPDRTCAVQSIAAVSRFLVSVTYLTGGDCKVVPSPISGAVLDGLVARIDAAFPG